MRDSIFGTTDIKNADADLQYKSPTRFANIQIADVDHEHQIADANHKHQIADANHKHQIADAD